MKPGTKIYMAQWDKNRKEKNMPYECQCCECALARALQSFHQIDNPLEKYLATDGLVSAIDDAISAKAELEPVLWGLRARVLEKQSLLEEQIFSQQVKN
jgi:hypothetical protein